MKQFRIRLGWMHTAALVCGLLAPLCSHAAVIGSGIYAPDCNDQASRVTVEIFGDGSAEVLSGGQTFPSLRSSKTFFGDETPGDFHTAVIFNGAMAPIGEGAGGQRWLEIWMGEAGFSVRPNGDSTQRWQFCETVPTLGFPMKTGIDCGLAQAPVDVMICSDARLGDLNYRLTKTIQQAERRARGAEYASLHREQQDWLERRNHCWNASDRRACIAHETSDRIALLSVGHNLIRPGRTSRYRCVSWAGEWIYATPYATEPAAMKLVRGGATEIALRHSGESGVKYVAESGVSFWSNRDEALVEWPSHQLHRCWKR